MRAENEIFFHQFVSLQEKLNTINGPDLGQTVEAIFAMAQATQDERVHAEACKSLAIVTQRPDINPAVHRQALTALVNIGVQSEGTNAKVAAIDGISNTLDIPLQGDAIARYVPDVLHELAIEGLGVIGMSATISIVPENAINTLMHYISAPLNVTQKVEPTSSSSMRLLPRAGEIIGTLHQTAEKLRQTQVLDTFDTK